MSLNGYSLIHSIQFTPAPLTGVFRESLFHDFFRIMLNALHTFKTTYQERVLGTLATDSVNFLSIGRFGIMVLIRYKRDGWCDS